MHGKREVTHNIVKYCFLEMPVPFVKQWVRSFILLLHQSFFLSRNKPSCPNMHQGGWSPKSHSGCIFEPIEVISFIPVYSHFCFNLPGTDALRANSFPDCCTNLPQYPPDELQKIQSKYIWSNCMVLFIFWPATTNNPSWTKENDLHNSCSVAPILT
jgi:hypothetical protein